MTLFIGRNSWWKENERNKGNKCLWWIAAKSENIYRCAVRRFYRRCINNISYVKIKTNSKNFKVLYKWYYCLQRKRQRNEKTSVSFDEQSMLWHLAAVLMGFIFLFLINFFFLNIKYSIQLHFLRIRFSRTISNAKLLKTLVCFWIQTRIIQRQN